jgi:hypothetical protein
MVCVIGCRSGLETSAGGKTESAEPGDTPAGGTSDVSASDYMPPWEESGGVLSATLSFETTEAMIPSELSLLNAGDVGKLIITERIFAPNELNIRLEQSIYRSKESESENDFHAYLSIDGVKYDLGKVGYGDDYYYAKSLQNQTFSPLVPSGEDLSFPPLPVGGALFKLHKFYGAKYDAVAYYLLTDGIPFFLCELIGVVEYSDYDGDKLIEILGTDRSVPYTGYTIYKLDLEHNVLRVANLNNLLGCDGIHYDEAWTKLFFTYDKWFDESIGDSGQYVLKNNNIYRCIDGIFVCEYAPVK